MIVSKHNTYGSRSIFGLSLIYVFILIGSAISWYSGADFLWFKNSARQDILLTFAILGGSLVILISVMVTCIKKITIDEPMKTITFKNMITGRSRTYDFVDFDGYIKTYLNHKHSAYETVGLVKDGRVIRYIDSFWVSNYDELCQPLEDLNFLGTYKFGIWKQLKLLFRKPVIDGKKPVS